MDGNTIIGVGDFLPNHVLNHTFDNIPDSEWDSIKEALVAVRWDVFRCGM